MIVEARFVAANLLIVMVFDNAKEDNITRHKNQDLSDVSVSKKINTSMLK